MTDMKIKAIAPWFGGKRTLAPVIVKELGKHTQYFYQGWTFIANPINKQLNSQVARGDRKLEAPEVLIVNGYSYAEKS